jgi:predicted lipoprotein
MKDRRVLAKLVWVITATSLGTALRCSSGRSATDAAASLLADLGRVVAVPAHAELESAAAALRDALWALRDSPTAATLATAHEAFRAARRRYKRCDPLLVGTLEREGYAAALDFVPASEERVEAAVAGASDAPTIADIDALGANQKGFGALEILLFDAEAGDAQVLSRLTSAESGLRRRRFAAALGEHLAQTTARLRAAWSSLAGEVALAGRGSSVFASQQAALLALLTRVTSSIETAEDQGLARPLGKRTGGVPQPDAEVARRSDETLAGLVEVVAGARDALFCRHDGSSGHSVAELLGSRDPALASRLEERFNAALAGLAAIPFPLRVSLTTATAAVESAFERLVELVRTLATEVASALGLTLGFTSNDGD